MRCGASSWQIAIRGPHTVCLYSARIRASWANIGPKMWTYGQRSVS
jgi:hypothetical protein